jgi:hypothetical protein
MVSTQGPHQRNPEHGRELFYLVLRETAPEFRRGACARRRRRRYPSRASRWRRLLGAARQSPCCSVGRGLRPSNVVEAENRRLRPSKAQHVLARRIQRSCVTDERRRSFVFGMDANPRFVGLAVSERHENHRRLIIAPSAYRVVRGGRFTGAHGRSQIAHPLAAAVVPGEAELLPDLGRERLHDGGSCSLVLVDRLGRQDDPPMGRCPTRPC